MSVVCGRYSSTSRLEDLADVFRAEEVCTEPMPPRYNVAPTMPVYAVALRRGHRALGTFRWGLVPSWAKEPSVGNRMINARAEGLATSRAYRTAMDRRRCLIPADAFFEWQRRPGPGGKALTRVPHAIRRVDGHPMAFAGLWEVWHDPASPGGGLLRTCAIVTTAANEVVAPVHGRMPAVLDVRRWATWLDPATDFSTAWGLLAPAPCEWFEVYPVSTLVNDVRHEGPGLLEPMPAAS